MRTLLPTILGVASSCLTSLTVAQASIARAGRILSAANAAEVTSRLAMAVPGDTILLSDGNWINQHIVVAGSNGTRENPITLQAETAGQVVLSGNSRLSISGSWITVSGLRFDGGQLAGAPNEKSVIEFRVGSNHAQSCRLTNSSIIGYNPINPAVRYSWVSLYGQDNRVDHNYFSDHAHSGVTVVVERENDDVDGHLIDHNHFADRPDSGGANGWESIRVGDSSTSLSTSGTTVEQNLFSRTDGEIEIISNKSGGNIYRHNTFLECAGTLTLRHGNDALVEGNFFLGNGKDRSGGVRVIGTGHRIINNYFAGLDDRADGVLSISAGVPMSPLNGYVAVSQVLIAHNTVIASQGPMITFDHGWGSSGRSLLAQTVTIANNVFRSNGPALFEGAEGGGWVWLGNLVFGGPLGSPPSSPGYSVSDPLLEFDAGNHTWRPSRLSPARDTGSMGFAAVIARDMDGQVRFDGMPDIGADERTTNPVVYRPLLRGDTGPRWLRLSPATSSGCHLDHCALQGEDYAAGFDRNLSGRSWRVASDPTASGQLAIKASLGTAVNPTIELHDAVVVYRLKFQQPGTYGAYYRARGFSGSSNSFYVPTSFDVDPGTSESLSIDGLSRWERGLTYTVSAAQVGVPLEFGIGRRERLAELDGLVLHLDANLTDQQLDTIL